MDLAENGRIVKLRCAFDIFVNITNDGITQNVIWVNGLSVFDFALFQPTCNVSLSHVMRKLVFALCENKAPLFSLHRLCNHSTSQIRNVKPLAISCGINSPVCVETGRKPRRQVFL